MFITDLFEAVETMDTVVVYPGRFQPWHIGHHKVYNYLVGNFGRDRVFIATSNKVAPPRSPFSFGEKLQFMNFTGIPGDVVVETTDPYKVPELVNKLNSSNTRLIFAVSEKDMQEDPRFKFGTKKDGSPTYFQPMPKDASQMQPLTHHGYIMVVPTFEFKVLGKVVKSATDIRALFASGNDQTQKQIIVDLFGKYSPEIHALMKSKIALTEAPLIPLQTVKQQIAQKTKDEVSSWEQDFLKNVAAKRGVGTSQPVAQPAPTAPQPTEKHSVLKNRLANLDIAIAKQQQLDLLRAKAEARGLLNPGLEADTDTSLYIKDAAKDNYQSLIQKIDSSIQAIKSRMNMKRLAYKESTFEQLAESQVLDLTKNFPNHAQVHAQVVDVLPSGKVKLQIVKADPITGKKPTLAVGQKLSMALNYLRNVQPVGDVAEDLLEAREGVMREIIRKALPGWPDYVIKDWISSRIKNEEDLKNLQGWMGELNKMVQPNSWKLHQKMFLTFDMLSPKSRYFMKTKRQFGARNPFLIPRDEERSAGAEQLIKTQGMENLPPVTMLQHANGLELCEGWHRTMAAFRLHPEGFYINAWIGQASQQGVAEGFLGNAYTKLKSVVLNILGKKTSTTSNDTLAFQRMMSKVTAPVDASQYARLWQEYKADPNFYVSLPRTLQDLENKEKMYLWANSISQFVMNKFPDAPIEALAQAALGLTDYAVREFKKNQDVKEGVNDYLWHGSREEHNVLYPQQANDTGGKEESNKNAVYATPSAKVAIAMGLTTPGSDTGMFPNDPQMVLFSGNIRKGQMVYLHKVPKDLFIKHNDREWYSKPGVEAVKPLEIKAVPVNQWLNLIRTATPQDLELRKKYMKEGVEEGKVIPANFGTGKYYKNPDIEIPMYDPVLGRKWDPAYSGNNPQEPFDDFEAVPAGRTSAHIVGIKDGKQIRISTAPAELANVLVDAYKRGGFTDKSIEKVPLKEEDPEWSRPPGAGAAQTRQVMNKMNPANNKFIWKKPNQIGGSFSEQDLLAQGFKKSQYNSWGGTQSMWNRLLGVKETVLNRPTPSLRDLIKKYPKVPLDQLRKELQLGVKTEFEHTKNAKTAMEIALDHLNEKPDYYSLLHRAGLE